MNAIQVIQSALESTQKLTTWFVADLSDADLLVRPVPEANHIAWQLGHIITAEHGLFSKYLPTPGYPELPAGFSDKHSNKNTKDDGPAGFLTKAKYLDLWGKIRQATVAAVNKLSEADLDKPTGWEIAPTLGRLLLLIADHTTMHGGQFSVVRRKLGKPVLF
jgi:hypothetical protein